MCFKKIVEWFKPDPIVYSSKTALLFGDNYPGTDYELSGCINDIDDVEKKLNSEFSGFAIKKIKNNDVTCNRFYNEIKTVLRNGKAGDFLLIWYSGHGTQLKNSDEVDGYDEAFYFSDGPFTDDRMLELEQLTPEGMLVNANLDSCFSGGMDRELINSGNPKILHNRFHQMPGLPHFTKRVGKIVRTESKWVINAFCQEGQTCADATFNGRANGAGTYYFLKCFTTGTAFNNAMSKLHIYLPGHGFDQDPILIGNENLFNENY
jgi:hypothetical protein